MRRTDLYVKVELDYDDEEKVERLAAEICRVIRRVYGVRKAEVSSMIERET
jgi:CRISPR/Cas system-associated exonuclease Cas4 (RecB family)